MSTQSSRVLVCRPLVVSVCQYQYCVRMRRESLRYNIVTGIRPVTSSVLEDFENRCSLDLKQTILLGRCNCHFDLSTRRVPHSTPQSRVPSGERRGRINDKREPFQWLKVKRVPKNGRFTIIIIIVSVASMNSLNLFIDPIFFSWIVESCPEPYTQYSKS